MSTRDMKLQERGKTFSRLKEAKEPGQGDAVQASRLEPSLGRSLLGHLVKLEWRRRIRCSNLSMLTLFIFEVILWFCRRRSLLIGNAH